jgi:nucleoside-diphosphate-sugar epimerase
MTTYLITGGAGFIGSHIASRLIQDNHRVIVLDNFLTGKPSNIAYLQTLGGDFVFHQTDISDYNTLEPLLKNVDIVFHQAALPSVPRSVSTPLETHHHCVTATLNVLTASQRNGVKKVVYAGSSSAYGNADVDVKVETLPTNPISPYGAAKLAGETYCKVFYHTYGLETVVLRYFNVFGERQDPNSEYAAVIPKFIRIMLKDESPVIYGDGLQTRDFTYIANVVHGNLLAAHTPNIGGEVINVATGGQVSLLELVQKLNAILGKNIAPILGSPRLGDVLHSKAGITKAHDMLDYTPIVSVDEGLERLVAWSLQQ